MRKQGTKKAGVAIAAMVSLAVLAGCSADMNTGMDGGGGEYTGGGDYADGDGAMEDGGDVDGDGGDVDADGDGDGVNQIPAGQLTAGEWRDLDNWDFWMGLFESSQEGPESLWAEFEEKWSTSARQRLPVVVSEGDLPVINAEVTLLDGEDQVVWSTRTDNQGRAELMNGMFSSAATGPFTVVTALGDAEVEVDGIDVITESMAPLEVEFSGSYAPNHKVDLMFMIDTTGSMGDELSYIQSELRDVIERVQEEVGPTMELRVSVNFYRDAGDEYVVRSFPFRFNDEAVADLIDQSSAGGGDYPEAVDQGMEDAVFEHQWSYDATARLLFFVLDAPPHDDHGVRQRLEQSVVGAAEAGIRIIPLMGSGYDRETEYLMRSYAIATGGTFTFLTDDSGIGNSHMEPTVGAYEVELLNNLMVRIVKEYSVLPQGAAQ